MYHIPSARDFTTENIHRRMLQSHPAYSFNYKSIESMFDSKRVEYRQDDLYEGKFTDVQNYDQKQELDIPSFRTHIPIEHQQHPEMIEPILKEYDPDIQKALMDITMEEIFDERMQNLVDYLTSILESEPDSSELVNDFFANIAVTPETNIDDQLLSDAQSNEVELDDLMENDSVIEDISLDVIIDEIFAENMAPDKDDQFEEPIEPFMPFY